MRYIIPAGTVLDTAEDVQRRRWRRHTTRRTLVFNSYRLSIGGEFTFAYRGRLLRVDRSRVRQRPDDGPIVYALIFSLATEPPEFRDLVVQLDEHAESAFTKPVDPAKTLLDVRAGDSVVHGGRTERVIRVAPFRTSAADARSA